MSLYARRSKATQNRDAKALADTLHEDYAFVRHQSDTRMNKADVSAMLEAFMNNESVIIQNQRCLYENDEVLVEHSIMDFADGSRESVIAFHRLQDGLIIQTETGATPVAR